MKNYAKTVNKLFKYAKRKDRKRRKKVGLSKTWNDFESLEYRKKFDEFYVNITNELMNALAKEVGQLPESINDSHYSKEIQKYMYHENLEEVLLVPHAMAKLIDYRTSLGGTYLDIAKLCNLSAYIYPIDTLSFPTPKYDMAIASLLIGLKELHLLPLYSKQGMLSALFFYWLIYDTKSKMLNNKILVDIAEKEKGSFINFKSHLFGYWSYRSFGGEEDFYSVFLRDKT